MLLEHVYWLQLLLDRHASRESGKEAEAVAAAAADVVDTAVAAAVVVDAVVAPVAATTRCHDSESCISVCLAI